MVSIIFLKVHFTPVCLLLHFFQEALLVFKQTHIILSFQPYKCTAHYALTLCTTVIKAQALTHCWLVGWLADR